MLTRPEVERLLYALCVDLGFCLSPADRETLCQDPPATVREFVECVFRAEGLDPHTAERGLYRSVHELTVRAFREARSR